MDVPRRAKLKFCSSLTLSFAAIFIFSSLAGCFVSKPPPAAPVTISFTELTRAIAQARGLPLKQEMKLQMLQSDVDTALPDRISTGTEGLLNIAQVDRAYKRIGLLPESGDFARAIADYRRLERMVDYEAQSATVVIRPQATSLGQAFLQIAPRSAAETPGVFGIVQALQEQHFHWRERLKSIGSEDRRLALRAVATGDAVLVALSRADHNKLDLSSAATVQTLDRLASAVEKSAAGLPELLRYKLVFPYRGGSRFVSWAQAAKGWQGVNALFTRPPFSTSQILHPEKYYIQKESLARIQPWGLARQMKDTSLVEQTLGEYLTRLLLSLSPSSKEAERIASGWQDDLLRVYKEGDSVATIWLSAWKSDKEAMDFFRAYTDVLEKLHRVRFLPAADGKDATQAALPGGRVMRLQVQGPAVLLLDGLNPARSAEIAQDIWRDLEIEKEPTAIPFESAMLSVSSRREDGNGRPHF